MEKRAIIIGAGPAGLTAAYELLKRTDIKPVILEKSGDIGGISKTVNYKGNRIDIGGHRFFSKSDRVMNWWMNIMPVEESQKKAFNITYQNKSRKVDARDEKIPDPDRVMLVRPRLSRIYFLRKFFTYPIQLSIDTLRKLGLFTTIAIMFSYLKAQLLPRRPEKSLEDFMINRFGQVLYKLFFRDYTQKVWGVPCQDIPAEWGAQRIKGLSISKAIQHAIQSATKRNAKGDISQKATETSLIEQFLYPKYGPGQLWEEVARQVESMGGIIHMNHVVEHVYNSADSKRVTAIAAVDTLTGESLYLEGDYFFSTMPVKELIAAVDGAVPEDVKEIAAGLQYRDFITVGILLRRLSSLDERTGEWKPLELKDTWIYIQESDVKVGRLQIFNNWSPYMVKDPDTVWIGMEFFCDSTDSFWNKSDAELKALAVNELEKIGLANSENVLDSTVIRMEKTYPAYFGTYKQFDQVRNYTDQLENLFLVGRNGMHKYNNSDHSMLTAMVAVDNICQGITSKKNIWAINTEQEYHEEHVESKIARKIKDKDGLVEQEARLSTAAAMEETFFAYLKLRENRIALATILGLLIAQLIGLKILFPFANYLPDSYAYIEAAWLNAPINMWPVGYSKFLRVFSAVFQSDIPLVYMQYFMLNTAIFYFTYTIFFFTKPTTLVRYIILTALTINPIILLTSNYVSSDALFTSLSLVWITQLVWILLSPKKWQIYTHALALVLAFTVRYNALYYPLISMVVLLSSRFSFLVRLQAMALTVGLLGLFVWHSQNKYEEISNTRQFSSFGGWQLAANALYAYSRIPNRNIKATSDLAELHTYTKLFIDSLSGMKHRPDSMLGIYYLWDGPLVGFLNRKYGNDSITPYFKKYASLAPLYQRYGEWLINAYPREYTKYFLMTNVIRYYAPPSEFLSQYNMQQDTVRSLAKQWFGYKTTSVRAFAKQLPAIKIYSVVFALINICFCGCIIGFLVFGGLNKAAYPIIVCIGITAAVWIINLFFSVLASPIVLRYQLFTTILLFNSSVYLIDFIARIDSMPNRPALNFSFHLPKLTAQ